MPNRTPFLGGFPTALFGSPKARAQDIITKKRALLQANAPGELSAQLSEIITADLVERLASSARKRVYSHTVVFWAFLTQVLSEDGSCAKAVALVQSWFRHLKLPIPSSGTSSYTKARKNLPEAMLDGIQQEIISKLERNLTREDLWRGHVVKATDGSSAQMPDTAANLKEYPLHPNQLPGCGYPTMGIGALINLCHGGWEQVTIGKWNEHDLSSMGALLAHIKKDEILLADRAYCSWELIMRLSNQGTFAIARHHQGRKIDFRKGKKLGPDERLVTWQKPKKQPKGSRLSASEWEQLDETIEVRVIRVRAKGRDGKKTVMYLATTLLDTLRYPAQEIGQLYAHRWEIELRFRDLKTTMGMEKLRTLTPEMARKEVKMHMIGYNAVRLLMLKAARQEGKQHRRLSYKGALQVLEAWSSHFHTSKNSTKKQNALLEEMLAEIANCVIPDRPGRNEPREVKTRSKPFNRLNQPRSNHPHHFRTDDYPQSILDKAA